MEKSLSGFRVHLGTLLSTLCALQLWFSFTGHHHTHISDSEKYVTWIKMAGCKYLANETHSAGWDWQTERCKTVKMQFAHTGKKPVNNLRCIIITCEMPSRKERKNKIDEMLIIFSPLFLIVWVIKISSFSANCKQLNYHCQQLPLVIMKRCWLSCNIKLKLPSGVFDHY